MSIESFARRRTAFDCFASLGCLVRHLPMKIAMSSPSCAPDSLIKGIKKQNPSAAATAFSGDAAHSKSVTQKMSTLSSIDCS
jgi:hypothetical protein